MQSEVILQSLPTQTISGSVSGAVPQTPVSCRAEGCRTAEHPRLEGTRREYRASLSGAAQLPTAAGHRAGLRAALGAAAAAEGRSDSATCWPPRAAAPGPPFPAFPLFFLPPFSLCGEYTNRLQNSTRLTTKQKNGACFTKWIERFSFAVLYFSLRVPQFWILNVLNKICLQCSKYCEKNEREDGNPHFSNWSPTLYKLWK